MALTYDLGGESVDRIFSYVCDLIAHHIETFHDSPRLSVMGDCFTCYSECCLGRLFGRSLFMQADDQLRDSVQAKRPPAMP